MAVRVGADVGGTFTDLYMVDDERRSYAALKIPTTPDDPSIGIVSGVLRLLRQTGHRPEAMSHLIHGTTVATNTVLQRNGSLTGLITTKGFRDVLEIARQRRPDLYDLTRDKVPPLVSRELRLEVEERINAKGQVLRPLDVQSVRDAARALREAGVRAIAICFLHAYRNPTHELQAAEIVRDVVPEAYVCTSSEVLPEFREYERVSTTVLNAYLGPVVSGYVQQLTGRLRAEGIGAVVSIVQSSGGVMMVEAASRRPAYLLLSGPTAGVVGGIQVACPSGFQDVITFDMGGTSTDVALVEGGRVPLTSGRNIAGLPCRTPMVDVETVGAGGGSIGWVDAGALKVGPQSAGAVPGPAAYGSGGREPTVTDANLLLGRLGTRGLLGGELSLDVDLARQAVLERVAVPLGLTLETAALGIIRVANANMVRAVRSVSVQRGYDPRRFALVAFGGAGPMHAVAVARELGIRTVLVPPSPGVLCAVGMLTMPIRTDLVRTLLMQASPASVPASAKAVAELVRDANGWLDLQGAKGDGRQTEIQLDMRYRGQNYELQVCGFDPSTETGMRRAVEEFHRVHQQAYGYAVPDRGVEIVNIRISATTVAPTEDGVVGGQNTGGASTGPAPIERRPVLWAEGQPFVDTPIFARAHFGPGSRVAAPAILEQVDSTTVLPPGASAVADASGNIVIDVGTEA
jgi:N-methylhydantoinase A